MIAESEVQGAVYTLIKNANLAGVTGIFDLNAIPANQAFPYIVLGETTMSPFDVFAANGQNIVFTIHTWSRYSGKKEASTLRGSIYRLLHGTVFTTDHYTGTMLLDMGNAMEDDSTSIKLIHSADRYRIRVTEQ